MKPILFVFVATFLLWVIVLFQDGEEGVPLSPFASKVYNEIRNFLNRFKNT